MNQFSSHRLWRACALAIGAGTVLGVLAVMLSAPLAQSSPPTSLLPMRMLVPTPRLAMPVNASHDPSHDPLLPTIDAATFAPINPYEAMSPTF